MKFTIFKYAGTFFIGAALTPAIIYIYLTNVGDRHAYCEGYIDGRKSAYELYSNKPRDSYPRTITCTPTSVPVRQNYADGHSAGMLAEFVSGATGGQYTPERISARDEVSY